MIGSHISIIFFIDYSWKKLEELVNERSEILEGMCNIILWKQDLPSLLNV